MKFKKNNIGLYFGLGLGTIALASSVATIVSCSDASKKDPSKTYPTGDRTKFTSDPNTSNRAILQSSIMNDAVSKSLVQSILNNRLYAWFETNNSTSIAQRLNDLITSVDKSYDELIKGKTEQELQQTYFDSNGGTKEFYKKQQIYNSLKSTFVDIVFSAANSNLISVLDKNNKYVEINSANEQFINDPANINGKNGPGSKNGFSFDARIKPEDNVEFNTNTGISDFLNFALDEYIANELPISVSAVLFSMSQAPTFHNDSQRSPVFDVNFFGLSNITAETYKYRFQYFDDQSTSQIGQYSTTEKFQNALSQLRGSGVATNPAINPNTGILNFNGQWSDDPSGVTFFSQSFANFYNTYVTPFAAGAAYKFAELFNNSDANVPTIDANNLSIDIMNNFLVGNAGAVPSSNGNAGVFNFPYLKPSSGSPFLGEYSNATGVRDVINITMNGQPSPFIMVRNEFGIHLMGLDRFYEIKQGFSASGKTGAFNEIRNALIYRYALYKLNSNSKLGYDLWSALRTYLDQNFEKVLINYIQKSNDENNLFNSRFLKTDTPSISFETNDAILLNAWSNLSNAKYARSIKNNINNKVSSYSAEWANNSNAIDWRALGIAGVLPYTRTQDGAYSSLTTLYNETDAQLDARYNEFYLAAGTWLTNKKIDVDPNAATYTKYTQVILTNSPELNYAMVQQPIKVFAGHVKNPMIYSFTDSVYDKKTALFKTESNTEIGSTDWVFDQLNNVLYQNYFVDFFKKQKNFYQFGNWSTLSEALNIGKKIFDVAYNAVYKSLGNGFIQVADLDSNADIATFNEINTNLIASIIYLLTPELDEKGFIKLVNGKPVFSFKNFQSYLSNIITDGQDAFVAWCVSESIESYPDFGTNLAFDFGFKSEPVNLTNKNPYSFQGSNSAFDPQTGKPLPTDTSNITYTTNTNYWNSATAGPMYSINTGTQSDLNLQGWYGLQTATSNTLPSNGSLNTTAFSNSVWKNNNINGQINWTGALYEFGSLERFIGKIKEITSIGRLSKFIENIESYGFVTDEAILKELSDIKTGILVEESKQKLIDLIQNKNIIPAEAFNRYSGQLYTTFDLDTSAIKRATPLFGDVNEKEKYQIVITQVNKFDVDNMIIDNKLNTSPTGFLGLTPNSFFNLLLTAAKNPDNQQKGIDWILSATKPSNDVFDLRLNNALGVAWVNNWWTKDKDEKK